MNKRKRHAIKKEKKEKEKLEKEKKEKSIRPIVLALIAILGCIASFFEGKAINDGNLFFIFLPLISRVTIFAAFIILVIILVIRQKLR